MVAPIEIETKTICKIYFNPFIFSPVVIFCQGIWDGNLKKAILKRAHMYGIKQALSYSIDKENRKDEPIGTYHSMIITHNHSACIELRDTEENVRWFLSENQTLLKETNMILLKRSYA